MKASFMISKKLKRSFNKNFYLKWKGSVSNVGVSFWDEVERIRNLLEKTDCHSRSHGFAMTEKIYLIFFYPNICYTTNAKRIIQNKNPIDESIGSLFWWERVDSNHRSRRQQIYSLPPLATREHSHIKFKNAWSWWTDTAFPRKSVMLVA